MPSDARVMQSDWHMSTSTRTCPTECLGQDGAGETRRFLKRFRTWEELLGMKYFARGRGFRGAPRPVTLSLVPQPGLEGGRSLLKAQEGRLLPSQKVYLQVRGFGLGSSWPPSRTPSSKIHSVSPANRPMHQCLKKHHHSCTCWRRNYS